MDSCSLVPCTLTCSLLTRALVGRSCNASFQPFDKIYTTVINSSWLATVTTTHITFRALDANGVRVRVYRWVAAMSILANWAPAAATATTPSGARNARMVWWGRMVSYVRHALPARAPMRNKPAVKAVPNLACFPPRVYATR